MTHTDVLIVGAGLSGIGAAVHLQERCPKKTYVVLEGRAAMGGTWDLFRYPGVRSDIDMYTLGYGFKPWRQDVAIADGASIRAYIEEAAAEHGVSEHIQYRRRVTRASWSSTDAAWTVEALRADTGETVVHTCSVLLMCSGYYSYREGYTPELEGRDSFRGLIVHAQKWPEGLNFRGKRVVVIGSGATAVTLVPALAATAAHVVMLQRSPSYVMSIPDRDAIANAARRVLPERWAYAIARWRHTALQLWLYRQARRHPAAARKQILDGVRKELGADYDVETHFSPRYAPWEQRVCFTPNGEFFAALREGRASVVTDRIERITETGIALESGRQLDADVIVTATGLTLVTPGDCSVVVDGVPVDFARTWTYKGRMFSGVPNLVHTMGYVNAAWTLRADLTAEFACRLLNHMDATGARQVTPRLRAGDRGMVPRPWIDGFSPGYMQRGLAALPWQGAHEPWLNPQHYLRDRRMIRGPLDDGALVFAGRGASPAGQFEAEGAPADSTVRHSPWPSHST